MSITAEHPVKCLGVRIVVGRHQRFGGGGELGEEPRAGRCGGVDAAVGGGPHNGAVGVLAHRPAGVEGLE